ncbi:MAG TPA: LysR family transcriptional regulator [Methylocella sp.]|nr:LysR family transcriptional regulator [Methylocella sp.]
MIDKLEFLIALAREKSFSRAAESCGVTQPTLSAGIKQLEDSLGVLLVNRSSRFYGLTAEGERVLEWGKRIVSDARAMRQDLYAAKASLSGHLRIAAVPTAAPVAAELTIPFQARHPGVRFTVLSKTSREILAMLDDFQIDAGLTYLDNEPLGERLMVPLYHERYLLLTGALSPFGEQEKVIWADVARLPLCLLTPDMQNRRIIDKLLPRPLRPPLESNSMLVLFSHVRCGGYACVISEKLAGLLSLSEELRAIPIDEPGEVHTIGVVAPRREPVPPLTKAFLAEASKLARLESCKPSEKPRRATHS